MVFSFTTIQPGVVQRTNFHLRKNTITTLETIWQTGFNGDEEYIFYDCDKYDSYADLSIAMQEKEVIYRSEFDMSIYAIEHERTVYGVLDLFGDVGGILEAVTIFLGVFLYPLSEFAFVV